MIPRSRATGRAVVYQAFYRLPLPVRRRLVRLAVPKYIVGAVTLVRDSRGAGPGPAAAAAPAPRPRLDRCPPAC